MFKGAEVRHIKLDKESAQIQRFVLSLPVDPAGSILELNGDPVLRVLPITAEEESVDKAKLSAAIRRRRDESRRLNDEWAAVDRDAWNRSADGD